MIPFNEIGFILVFVYLTYFVCCMERPAHGCNLGSGYEPGADSFDDGGVGEIGSG